MMSEVLVGVEEDGIELDWVIIVFLFYI